MIDKAKLHEALKKINLGIAEIGLAIVDADPVNEPEDRHLLSVMVGDLHEVIHDLAKAVNKVRPTSLN